MRIYLHFEKSFGLFLLNDLEILTASKGELDCFWMSSSSWSSGIHPHLQRRVKSELPQKMWCPKKDTKDTTMEQIISKMLFMNQRSIQRISITMNSFMTFSFFCDSKSWDEHSHGEDFETTEIRTTQKSLQKAES